MANKISTFDSTKEPLADLLKGIDVGKIQLPDFQRGWVWDDHHILSLVASIGQAYPIGAVMSLENGNSKVNFKTRPFEGAPEMEIKSERLILDGQQRLTSLYQSLYSAKSVKTRDTKGKQINKFYFVDINKALADRDLEEAIISVPESRVLVNFRGEIKADYSTDEKQWIAHVFPLNIVFEVSKWNTWQQGYLQAEGAERIPARLKKWNEFYQMVLQPIQQYYVPVIELNKETSKAAICNVFEKVNTGGVSLTVFELLTATFAIDDFNLRDDWKARELRFNEYPILKKLPSDNFLQAISLISTYSRRKAAEERENNKEKLPAISCKRKDILRMALQDYTKWADLITEGFIKVARFLHTQNIFAKRDLPYATQVVPLAVVLTLLGDQMENDGVRRKIKRWYWCGVLGELYGSATETRFAKDVPELLTWINGAQEPDTVANVNFQPERLLRLRSRGSAAYKGLYALMLLEGALDFRSGESINSITYFEDAVDIHHIFPKAWCIDHKVSSATYDSIINKTPLSYRTNRKIGRKAPSLYLSEIREETNASAEEQRRILNTHIISLEQLQQDLYEEFFETRGKSVLRIISEAIGKTISLEADQTFLSLAR